MGAETVHMHPHVCGAAMGEATLIDFRRLCSVAATMCQGVWLNLGAGGMLMDTFHTAAAVVRNFGHALDGLSIARVAPSAKDQSPSATLDANHEKSFDLSGPSELVLPILHTALACRMTPAEQSTPAQAA
jgi:hypothetical protein